jgi:gliding motility-associated-like protein
MNIFANIRHILICGIAGFAFKANAQNFEDCIQVIAPFSWGGIEVDHIIGDNVVVQSDNQPNSQVCFGSGYVVQYPNIHLGAHDGSCGWNPFNYKLNFSKPIISISLMLVNGNMVDVENQLGEDFVFKSECSSVSIQSLFSCNSTIVVDTLYLGGSDVAPSVGHGWFRIMFSQPVKTFSISGSGGGCGSGFKICANSLNQAPLWAGVHGSEVVCGSGSLSFERYGWLAGPYTYTYNINGGAPQTYVTSEILAEIPLAELFGYEPEPGQYTLELTEIMDGSGWPVALSCNTSHTFEVAQKPMAQFTATPTTGFVPLQVTTQNQSSNATEYEWLVNGGWLSGAEAPTLTLEEPNTYEITLIASNALGCTDTAKQTIHVLEELQVLIPNVFTPNNDGINDWFGITANVSVPASVVILNRWGNVVFEKDFATEAGDFQELWNGNGLTDGVYFYRVALDGEGWSEEFTGFVTVKK